MIVEISFALEIKRLSLSKFDFRLLSCLLHTTTQRERGERRPGRIGYWPTGWQSARSPAFSLRRVVLVCWKKIYKRNKNWIQWPRSKIIFSIFFMKVDLAKTSYIIKICEINQNWLTQENRRTCFFFTNSFKIFGNSKNCFKVHSFPSWLQYKYYNI